jgi:hypothetical protein
MLNNETDLEAEEPEVILESLLVPDVEAAVDRD